MLINFHVKVGILYYNDVFFELVHFFVEYVLRISLIDRIIL